jgi:DNA-binding HxlR family transcriptional regulator
VRTHTFACPAEATVAVIGGKWKLLILYQLMQGTCRFNELRRQLPHVTQQTLTLQLRELEQDGIIQRKVYAEVPPRVEYSITDVGRSLEPIIVQMVQWGENYIQKSSKPFI